jgi:hypothetical protein
MFKIDDYKIVHNVKAESVAEEVKKLMDDGWQPFGNLSTSGDHAVYYSQAMVIYGEKLD